MSESGLKLRWEELCQGLGVSKDMEQKWWNVLKNRYTESQRAYHTLSHLDEMFGFFEEHLKLISDAASVSLAIFFHDVIYDPKAGSPQNEIDSADVFDHFVQEALPGGSERGFRAMKVRRWIVQTAHHKCTEDDEMDCKLFMDFDMAVLGRPWPQYEAYSQQIRQEYSHVSEALYCAARGAFLTSTATDSRSKIFATDIFRNERERQAMENAAQEAEVLRAKLDRCSLIARIGASIALRLKALASANWSSWSKLTGVSAVGLLAGSAIVAAPVHVMLGVGLPVSAAAGYLAVQLGTSTYIRQPLPTAPEPESGLALIAGSFNPPHQGHLEMVRYLSARYQRVHAIIGVNPNKKYDVSPYERQELFRAMLKEIGLTNVDVIIVWSYIWKHAQQHGAKVMYRGLRSFRKDGASEKCLELQNISGQLLLGRVRPIPTAYIQADPRFSMVSSTLIRERLKRGESITELVPGGCASLVQRCYAEKIA